MSKWKIFPTESISLLELEPRSLDGLCGQRNPASKRECIHAPRHKMECDLNPRRLTWDLAVSLRAAISPSALFSWERRESWEDRATGKKTVVTRSTPARCSDDNLKPPSPAPTHSQLTKTAGNPKQTGTFQSCGICPGTWLL